MFGYVKPLKRELLVKDYEFYRATYCGVCRTMKKYTGYFSNAFLTYDSTFLALLRMVYLPDGVIAVRKMRCVAHPMKPRAVLLENEALRYTAAAFAILTRHKLEDDIKDERVLKRTARRMAKPLISYRLVEREYGALSESVSAGLDRIAQLEAERCPSADIVADAFGEVLAAVFSEGFSGEDRLITEEIGRSLGRFIYIADAAEDYERDRARGKYNPLVIMYENEPLNRDRRRLLHTALLHECRRIESAVNLLPFGTRRTLEALMHNIVYLGLPDRISFLEDEDE